MSKKIAVVTALIGAYDSQLLEFEYDRDEYEFICYTNMKRLKSNTWDIRYVDTLEVPEDNARSSYYYKWNPHKYLDNKKYDIMMWVDSSFTEINMHEIDGLVDRFYESERGLLIEKHPSRDTLAAELQANVHYNKDDIDKMTNQVRGYFNNGYDDSTTLMVETGLSIRDYKDESLIALSEMVWGEISPLENTKRDQLVFDYCCWKCKFSDYALFTFSEKCKAIMFTDHPHQSEHIDKVLLVGPWFGDDIGEEKWVTFVENYLETHPVDKVLVGCRPNRESLYSSISPDRFIITDPEGVREGYLLDGRPPRFNITSSSNKEILRLQSDDPDFVDVDKKIHILWATVRPDMFDTTYVEWISKADIPNNIVPHIIVDTIEQKDAITAIPQEYITVDKPPRRGVNYPSYVLSSNLVCDNYMDIVIYASDDFFPMKGWDTALYKEFTAYSGSLLVNDKCGPKSKDIMTIPIMTYGTLCRLNKIIYNPTYSHCWSDNELLLNLNELNAVKDIRYSKPQVYFEHKHYINGYREKDISDDQNGLTHYTGQTLWNVRRHMPLEYRLQYNPKEPILSILILTLPERKDMLNNLLTILEPQLKDNVEVIVEEDNRENTIGKKRNNALQRANGRYICFIDDDDEVSFDYVDRITHIIDTADVDCCSLVGEISIDGAESDIFTHSLKYKTWHQDDFKDGTHEYYRPPNHLNVVRRDVARFVGFKDISHGEDADYSKRMRPVISVEAPIDEVIYYYDAITNK